MKDKIERKSYTKTWYFLHVLFYFDLDKQILMNDLRVMLTS